MIRSPIERICNISLTLIVLVIFLCLIDKVVWLVRLKEWYRNGNDYSAELTPEHMGCKFDRQVLDSGRAHLKQSKVVICGLVRDKANRIPLMRSNVKRITDQFGDYRVLIVENDSHDNTRDKLLDWSKDDNKVQVLGCGINANKCELKLAKTVAHSTFTPRIAKMALLRNVYIDHMKSDPSLQDFDFAMVIDLDILGYTYVDGLWHTGYLFKQHPNWDAV